MLSSRIKYDLINRLIIQSIQKLANNWQEWLLDLVNYISYRVLNSLNPLQFKFSQFSTKINFKYWKKFSKNHFWIFFLLIFYNFRLSWTKSSLLSLFSQLEELREHQPGMTISLAQCKDKDPILLVQKTIIPYILLVNCRIHMLGGNSKFCDV